ncbi:unnamed protein product [Amoebophrya sp. A25]|nr:unnamed protein product [Amoebophrya sp. A25]|eukprot:GSA25T00020825001.1
MPESNGIELLSSALAGGLEGDSGSASVRKNAQASSLSSLLAAHDPYRSLDGRSDDVTAEEDDESRGDYTFHYLPEAKFRMWTDRGFQMLLTKWGLGESMCVGKWRFEERCPTRDAARNLVRSFFRSEKNRPALQALGISVLKPSGLEVDLVDISTTETSMAMFEKLEECGAVGRSGHIKGRLDEYVGDVVVNNLIREVFYMEESDLYDTYSAKERKEFIFRIFQHLVMGGATNQYEDDISEYLKATKAFLRDLVSVKKRDDGEPEVTSMVFEVTGLHDGSARKSSSGGLFKREHTTNFCYLIVDTLMRHVTMWKFAYESVW